MGVGKGAKTGVLIHETKWSKKWRGWGDLDPVLITNCSGLYYKRVTIIIDAPSVIKVTLQIVASLRIIIDDAS